ncbi:MAG: hypothetical protein GKS01_13620 [Alphaproteobacteria bacterium]|nr:hypothetical protein [Alphaproteobacteria bacterium]
MNTKKYIRSLYVTAALLYALAFLFAATWNGAKAQGSYQPDQAPFEMFAEEILSGIRATDAADIPAVGGYGKPRIAVVPFRFAKSTARKKDRITSDMAREFNDRLLAALTKQGAGTFRFVARETLKSVIREIDSISELEPDRDARVADLLRNAKVDILVVGTLRKDGHTASLSYKAVSTENGLVFAATPPSRIRLASPAPEIKRYRQPAITPIIHRDRPPFTMSRNGRRSVFHVQRMLHRLGYKPGRIDGIMKAHTRRAIRAYQRHNRLRVTGRLTRRLVRHMKQQAWRG